MTTPVHSSEPTRLEIRNLRFRTRGGEVPRHWLGGRRSVTTFFDTLSVFFPDGERFFVDAVKAHKDRAPEGTLRADVVRFCGQEGVHAREHIRYNEMLDAQGYPATRLQGRVGLLLDVVRRAASPRLQLAATCALEHFTAVMATFVLEDPRILAEAHPEMQALWRWHSAEEYEHRAVAFDLYAAAGGTYSERAYAMALAAAIFWTFVVVHQFEMMRADGTQWSLREWQALYRYLFVEPGPMPGMARRWLDYFRRDFHPRDHEAEEVFGRWKAAYAEVSLGG
jgi:predicted metal-dependent hydrolase